MSKDKLLALKEEGDGGLQAVRGHGVALEANRGDETLLEILLHHRDRDSAENKVRIGKRVRTVGSVTASRFKTQIDKNFLNSKP